MEAQIQQAAKNFVELYASEIAETNADEKAICNCFHEWFHMYGADYGLRDADETDEWNQANYEATEAAVLSKI